MTKTNRVLIVNLILLLAFLLIGTLDKSQQLNHLLVKVIEDNPIPKLYFPLFFTIGILFPIGVSIFKSEKRYSKKIIKPYLLLLAGQILTEIILLKTLGKGIVVVVGLIFSKLRIIQLGQLCRYVQDSKMAKIFLSCQFVLWAFNILQIYFNRILPLFLK